MKTRFPQLIVHERANAGRFKNLTVELEGAPDSSARDNITAAVETFAQLGELGGFCSGAWLSTESRCAMRSAVELPNGMTFVFDSRYVDHRAFQVLRNMLARLAQDEIRVSSIYIAVDDSVAIHRLVQPIISEDNEDSEYPTLNNAARLRVEDNLFDTRVRRCLIELHAPVEERHIDAMWTYVRPWFEALEAGGFAMPIDWPWATECMSDTITQFDEYTIEVSTLRFQASNAAWDSLANLVHHFALTKSAVASVTVE